MALRARLLVVGLVAAALQPLAAAPATAAPDCAEAGSTVPTVPWAQQMLNFERAWPLTRGDGVKVAVLDSGVDANQPQLRGRVVAGSDVLDHTDGRADCTGRGTQVAGIVAAQPDQTVAFRGVAPAATILPVRVSDGEPNGRSGGTAGLAAAIAFAVNNGARVILVSFALYTPDPALQAAVAAAADNDVLVIAAVGNDAGQSGANRTPLPAAYPNVVGVGAIDETSAVWSDSGHGSFVDLVAPGVRVASTQRVSGLVVASGTGQAAAFVAGAAALVRSRWPELPAAEVAKRLYATATPAPGGADSTRYGFGIVSPYAAVTELMATAPPASLPGLRPDGAAERGRAASWTSSATLALVLTAVGVLLALAVIGIGVAMPRGRRARWRARVAPRPAQRPEEHEPAPPVHLFADREQ